MLTLQTGTAGTTQRAATGMYGGYPNTGMRPL